MNVAANFPVITLRWWMASLGGILWLWAPVAGLVWWWAKHPPIFPDGPYEGALNWPVFFLYFVCCSIQFGRFAWSWMRN